ncbi:MalY/PatB family protein [Butyricicoccus intestinisimiae]|uniref:Pyridoxal phosphate-dependent aminotransferase n=1 Tax=Butyricicoccus intestinisimiae TaxID=2841509 RepID=A0ABS6ETB3_9FIRM|nr:MalY/PatB family protein [Butyricicoccus intestinisimiae]MBU5490797.1 pyridoxal phosphate-dependent aminotransferase [Butyricicoccus intestinisimiae]
MPVDFDTVPNRRGTNCFKYDFAREMGMPEDVLPLWVADMDFPTAHAVLERLHALAEHGIFGYTGVKDAYFSAVHNWYAQRFGWETQRSWLVTTPGVVFAIAIAIRAFTQKGDAILIQQPVYYPFANKVTENDRQLVVNPLVLKNGRYEMDFADMERKIVDYHVKMLLLCSPHNPVGRVWTKEELLRVGEICQKHGVLVVSDEIHADFTYAGHTHHVFASVKSEFADFTITCTAPSKTFNLAGLQNSNIFIPNRQLRHAYKKELSACGCGGTNCMGMAACQAAYEAGADWLEQLKQYLAGNLAYVRQFLREKLPDIALIEPEGTYLVWLDLRKLGLTEQQQRQLIVQDAKLWLDTGTLFGQGGEGFERINIACPRTTIEQAMQRLEHAVHKTR